MFEPKEQRKSGDDWGVLLHLRTANPKRSSSSFSSGTSRAVPRRAGLLSVCVPEPSGEEEAPALACSPFPVRRRFTVSASSDKLIGYVHWLDLFIVRLACRKANDFTIFD